MITVNTLCYTLNNGNIVVKESREEIDDWDNDISDISFLEVYGLEDKVYPSGWNTELYCFINYNLDEDKEKAIKIIEKEIFDVLNTVRSKIVKVIDNYDKIINKLQKKE